MKETSTRKTIVKQSKDLKQVTHTGLKSSMTASKKPPNKESFLPRTLEKYTELPSLRYGATTTETAFHSRKSGPLKLSFGCKNNYFKADSRENLDGDCSIPAGDRSNFTKKNGLTDFNGNPPQVRRVHFAELPPKSCSFFDFSDFIEKNGEREEEEEEEEERENLMKNRISISCIDGNSVSSSCFSRRGLSSKENFLSSAKIDHSKSGNVAEPNRSRGPEVIRGQHRKGTLNQKPRHPLPAILRAAKDGQEEEVAEVLKKASNLGITPEELNAVDGSGRTALSYIASNGSLKNLKAILKLPKIDINKQDNEGNTPLHFASQAGQVEAINYMLSICPNINIDSRNALGFTPLMKAALQGRTKCAKLLLFAGASPDMRDSGRGLRAEEWAKFCGRVDCAEVIEKFSRQKSTVRNGPLEKWGSEPELLRINNQKKSPITSNSSSYNLKSKFRKAFRTISQPHSEFSSKPYSVVSQLSTVALCASSPILQSIVSPSIKSLMRPLAVPKLEVTLASNYTQSDNADSSLQHSSMAPSIKEKENSKTSRSKKKALS